MVDTEKLWAPSPPSGEVLEAFISRHQELLALERAAEEEQTRLLNSNCSPRLLEARGLAIGSLSVGSISVGLGGKNLIELCRPLAYNTTSALPPHTFRNGDPVRIEAHVSSNAPKGKGKTKEEGEEQAVEGILYKVSAEKVIVAVDGAKEVDLPERLRLLKLANSVTFDRMEKTLLHLQKLVIPDSTAPTPSASNFSLINSLLGILPPTLRRDIPPIIKDPSSSSPAPPVGDSGEIKWFSEGLNDSQKEAIRFCLTTDQVACIHGPPGTGKTHTLVELVYQLLSRPASSSSSLPPRILIATPSNLALDNILLRLHTLSASPPYSSILPRKSILRIGHPTRVHRDLVGTTLDYHTSNGDEGELLKDVGAELEGHLSDLGKKRGEKGAVKGKERGMKWQEVRELRKEYRQREGKVVTAVVGRAQVVLATCHSAGSRQLNNVQFDICIIDEATQAVEANCWVPILKSKRLILAGDPQQLPPTILSRNDKTKKKAKTAKGKDAKPNGDKLPSDGAAADNKAKDAQEEEEEKESDTEPIAESFKETSITPKTTSLRPPRNLETTLFDRLERLYGPAIKRVLKTQYRMNESIATFPSSELYEFALISAPSVAKHTLLDLPGIVDPASEETIETLGSTVVFYDTAGCEFFERTDADDLTGGGRAEKGAGLGEGSKSNANEAEVVSKWARRLIGLGVQAEDIAVVTPYQAQVSLISELLHPEYPGMTIGSVDGLQGQEREAIILSLVRSNTSGEVGFLGEYRRLNVAMTRAKRQLCVVGDSSTVGKGSAYLKRWMGWLETNADVRWAGEEDI